MSIKATNARPSSVAAALRSGQRLRELFSHCAKNMWFNSNRWDWPSLKRRAEQLQSHKGGVRSLVFSPEGQRLFSCGDDSMSMQHDLSAASPTFTSWDHLGRNTIMLFDVNTRQPIGPPLNGHKGDISGEVFGDEEGRDHHGSYVVPTSSSKPRLPRESTFSRQMELADLVGLRSPPEGGPIFGHGLRRPKIIKHLKGFFSAYI